jgi:hypothetical protein
VDQYLEFLDKRYHRLHDDDHTVAQKPEPTKKFSAWEWLMDSPEANSSVEEQLRREEDALYILGVAELASQQLLQKHQLADKVQPRRIKPQVEPVLDAAVVVDEPKTRAEKLVEAGSSVLKRLGAKRRALVECQSRQLKNAFRFTARTVATGPVKATAALWNHGGGKKTVGLTASLLVAAFFVLRPAIATTLKAAMASASDRSLSA